MKRIPLFLIGLFAIFMLASGCSRSSYTSHYGPAIVFDTPATVPLPSSTSYAKKRGFADFNCDGVQDMLEIRDEHFGPGQDFVLTAFLGSYNESGILQFSETETRLELPIKLDWFSSATKLDVGDFNGDCYADVVFTQYKERIRGDVMHVAFALNDRAGGFTHYTQTVNWSGGSLGARILYWAGQHSYSSEDSLYDYLKMDWGDMNGDGSDDLVLAWDDWNDLDLYVLYTRPDESGKSIAIQGEGNAFLEGFTRNRTIREFDIEDFNGDGKQDLFIHKTHLGGKEFTATVALNTGNTNFDPRKDHRTTDTDLSLLRFEKYDTFDVNGDGCADFVHLGVLSGAKVMSYNLVTCN